MLHKVFLFTELLIFISHIIKYKGRGSEMVSRVVAMPSETHLQGRGKNQVSNIPVTFVLTQGLLIEVESPVGFSFG